MTKNKQLLLELSMRISRLEQVVFDKAEASERKSDNEISYKEVLDEWLNGKKS
ncbi:MAG: hypothetical protein IJW54_05215 [Clostridia bacterium]|nr:hypothetical protein [Clostridia bacterium]